MDAIFDKAMKKFKSGEYAGAISLFIDGAIAGEKKCQVIYVYCLGEIPNKEYMDYFWNNYEYFKLSVPKEVFEKQLWTAQEYYIQSDPNFRPLDAAFNVLMQIYNIDKILIEKFANDMMLNIRVDRIRPFIQSLEGMNI